MSYIVLYTIGREIKWAHVTALHVYIIILPNIFRVSFDCCFVHQWPYYKKLIMEMMSSWDISQIIKGAGC